jgi:hypothetical protein
MGSEQKSTIPSSGSTLLKQAQVIDEQSSRGKGNVYKFIWRHQVREGDEAAGVRVD